MQLAALLRLVRYLGEASGDTGLLKRPCEAVASIEASVAPVWRHRFQAHRAAFEHGLQPVDAAIALSQARGSAEAVARTVAHTQGPAALHAAWCIVDEPKLLSPAAASRTNEIAPRAAVRESCMGDGDEPVLLPKPNDSLPVLKSNSARGLEARHGEAQELVEEDALVRVASAFRHELEAAVRRHRVAVRCYYTIEVASVTSAQSVLVRLLVDVLDREVCWAVRRRLGQALAPWLEASFWAGGSLQRAAGSRVAPSEALMLGAEIRRNAPRKFHG
jgi:hypothetical protein